MSARRAGLILLALLSPLGAGAQPSSLPDLYEKYEYMVPMRDGVKLYTAVYVPRDRPAGPILLERTPYSAGPYGPGRYRGLRASAPWLNGGYIFAYQDVRGRYMSEGTFEHIRPQLDMIAPGPRDIDESTDTYDTVDFLVENVPNNNGNVGLWGISYPGFYAGVGAINTHPALKAVSPQAPVAEWFIGDDFHRNGVFFLQDAFSFMSWFEGPRSGPSPNQAPLFSFDLGGDAYRFFLNLGPVANAQTQYYKGRSKFWNDVTRHADYDDFWQSRSLPRHMRNVKCAVLTVGGWFDAEDLYGALHVYGETEKHNRNIVNRLVMGPWYHGMWAGGPGNRFHDQDFGQNTAEYYREKIELPFFEAHLRGVGNPEGPEATVFETGTNRWREFNEWPPRGRVPLALYFGDQGRLEMGSAGAVGGPGYDEYVSDPANPVPYEGGTLGRRSRSYMLADQRFADARDDVLTYQTPPLEKAVTVGGGVTADLYITTTGTDADFVVKLIDVYPDDALPGPNGPMGGYQMLVRGDVFRAKYRDGFSNPTPLTPGRVERVKFTLPDTMHTFRPGHRIMVQVQSSWFPLADRNPNQFLDIYQAKPEDFRSARIRIMRTAEFASKVTVDQLPN